MVVVISPSLINPISLLAHMLARGESKQFQALEGKTLAERGQTRPKTASNLSFQGYSSGVGGCRFTPCGKPFSYGSKNESGFL